MEVEILDTQIVYRNGSFVRIRCWLKGWYPEKGILIWGYTGRETVVDKDIIAPIRTLTVS